MPRPRKPIALHLAEGTYRPGRHDKDQPEYPVESSPPPAWLLPQARDLWTDLADQLAESGVMGPVFVLPLAMLCNSLARVIELEAIVAEQGGVIDTDNGPKRNPSLVCLEHAEAQALKMLREFGLTPASAAGVERRRPDDDGNPLNGLINPKLRGPK